MNAYDSDKCVRLEIVIIRVAPLINCWKVIKKAWVFLYWSLGEALKYEYDYTSKTECNIPYSEQTCNLLIAKLVEQNK